MAKYTGKFAGKHAKGRKSRLLIPVLAVVLLLGFITAGVAYYLQEAGAKASYQLAYVSCQVHEELAYDDGEMEKTSITVENTSNVPAYIRVRLISYWETPSGKIAGRTSPELNLSPDSDHWQSLGDNTWMYKAPVKPGESTGNLLTTSAVKLNVEDGYIPVVKVLAEAIQVDAVQAAWGVAVTP